MAVIGWIGLGNMGGSMSANLVKAGHDVRGFDLNPQAVAAAEAAGVKPVGSIAEAVETAQALGARRTYLTHLTHETGHADLEATLPAGILPAYDGLTVEVP